MHYSDDSDRSFHGHEEVVSASECTGLMPALPADREADAAQAKLYAIHSQHPEKEKNKCTKEEKKKP